MLYQENYTSQVHRKGNILYVKQLVPKEGDFRRHAHYPLTKPQHRPEKRSSLNTSGNDQSPFENIPGVCKLSDPNVTRSEKVAWCCVILVISGLCGYQVTERVLYYAQTPVNVVIQVEHRHVVNFPAVTVCPEPIQRKIHIHKKIYAALEAYGYRGSDYLSQGFTFKQLKLKIDDLMLIDAIEPHDIHVLMPCVNKMEKESCVIPVATIKTPLLSIFGQCVTVVTEEPAQFRGPSTVLILRTNHTAVRAFSHRPNISVEHHVYFMAQPLQEKIDFSSMVSVKEFYFRNTRSNPCLTPDEASVCTDNCILRKLAESNKLTCRVEAFGPLDLPVCETLEGGLMAQNVFEDAYMNLTTKDCACTRTCSDIVYSMTYDRSASSSNLSGINVVISYPENIEEIVKEEFCYSFAALISDVGGTLGFYLGFCILQCLETLVGVCKKCRLHKFK